jgi:hypothetical protein
MAAAALFIGFGQPARAREPQALDLLNEVLGLYSELAETGEIESFEPVLLDPHGGDLNGFLLIRGSREQIEALKAREDFQRTAARAGLVLDGFGVVDAHIGEGLDARLSIYEQQVNEQLSA